MARRGPPADCGAGGGRFGPVVVVVARVRVARRRGGVALVGAGGRGDVARSVVAVGRALGQLALVAGATHAAATIGADHADAVAVGAQDARVEVEVAVDLDVV